MKKVIFICSGNICRSPMANHYMQKKVFEIGKSNEYMIDSCGTYANPGDRATKNAIEAMKQYDVDMEAHRAKNIEQIDIAKYDLILCLTYSHKVSIVSLFPKISDKVYTLKEYVNPKEQYIDIDDPWGLDINIYKSCADEIVKNIDILISKF